MISNIEINIDGADLIVTAEYWHFDAEDIQDGTECVEINSVKVGEVEISDLISKGETKLLEEELIRDYHKQREAFWKSIRENI